MNFFLNEDNQVSNLLTVKLANVLLPILELSSNEKASQYNMCFFEK